jgi:hypothetical protein
MGQPLDRETILPHIFGEVAGGRSVDEILSADAGMPSSSTFWRWHMDDEALRDNLARARECGVERHVGEMVKIADDLTFDERRREAAPRRHHTGDAPRRNLRRD